MENNVSLVDSVMNDILPSNKYEQFDYGDEITNEQRQILIEDAKNAAIGRNACLEIMVSLYGKAIKHANEFYGHKKTGKYHEYVTVVLELSISTATRILKCYEEYHSHPNKKLYDKEGNERGILDLGAHKVRAISSLPENIKEQVYENSSELFEMNVKEVNEFVKKVKETGEYNEDLLNEIRQKDDKIKTKEAEAQQLQEEKDKKDQEIAELKAKLQEMEENFQPVEKVEPEVVEKIVEVEKVVEVEKEVVPEDIKEELETLRKIAKERNEIPEHIKNELFSLREQVAEKDALLNDAKDTVEAIATATNSKFGTQKVDWNLLGDIVSHFLGGASEYSYMETAYKEESIQKKNYVKTQVDKIEKWVLQMKQMMNESLTIGNVIYSDINYEVKDMEE